MSNPNERAAITIQKYMRLLWARESIPIDSLGPRMPLGPIRPKKPKIKCRQCLKKLSMMSFQCKCGNMYCITHQTPHMHKCSYDYKSALKNQITKENPKMACKFIPI